MTWVVESGAVLRLHVPDDSPNAITGVIRWKLRAERPAEPGLCDKVAVRLTRTESLSVCMACPIV